MAWPRPASSQPTSSYYNGWQSPIDWQPHILLFTDTSTRRSRVLRLAFWISGGAGLITTVQLIEGDSGSTVVQAQREEAEVRLRAELDGD